MANVSGAVMPVLVRFELSPTSGDTITFRAPYDHLLVTKGTTTAALTVVLPSGPADGDMVHISTVAAITALTLSPAPAGIPAGLIAGTGITLFYSVPSSAWFVWQQ